MAKAKKASEIGVRVRMYRVGFGDCFLVSFPAKKGSKSERAHVLIDCGVHSGTTGKGDVGSIAAAVEDLRAETGGKLALVVMTHRHADHISGFARCAEVFQGMTVEAVWMPVWEDEYRDPKMKALQDELGAMAFAMNARLATAPLPAAEHGEVADMLYNATGETLGARGGSNAAALELLKNGLGAEVSYLGAGDAVKLPRGLSRLGLTVKVLGPPPLEDAEYMRLMDLKKGVGQYLDGQAVVAGESFSPFSPAFHVPKAEYPSGAFAEWDPALRRLPSDPRRSPREAMEQAVQQKQPQALATAAKALDAFLNNQSLVLLFEIQGKRLLFVGDAQAGNWEHWLFEGGPTRTPDSQVSESAAEILGSLDFYKVGHHGSTNATPIAAVEALARHAVAMCSTQHGVYGSDDKGTEVPRKPLVDALAARAALVRSDRYAIEVEGRKVPAVGKEAPLPTTPRARLVKGELWVDCFL